MRYQHIFAAVLMVLLADSLVYAKGIDDSLRLSEADKGKAITANVGQAVEVHLPGEFSDESYSWRVKTIEYIAGPTCTVTEGQIGSSYIDPKKPALGRNYTISLKTAYPGKAKVTLVYSKTGTTEPTAIFDFTLTVKTIDDFRPPTDQPLRIDPRPLSEMLDKEIGGIWKAKDSVVYLSTDKAGMFYVFYAPCQQDQALVLNDMVSWMRPMAIIWAANGWTLVSDSSAWTHNRKQVDKLVTILEKFHPNDETWKTTRQLNREANE